MQNFRHSNLSTVSKTLHDLKKLIILTYMKINDIRQIEAGLGVLRENYSPEWVKEFHELNHGIIQEIVDEISTIHRVQINVEATLGFYEGDTEPSYKLTLIGTMKHNLGAISDWGRSHDQSAVRLIFPYDGAEGFLYSYELDPPILGEKLTLFRNELNERSLSATLIGTESGNAVKQVEYWGKSEDEEAAAIAIGEALIRIIGRYAIQAQVFEYGYQVLEIRKGEDYWYMKESAPKRDIQRGAYSNRYRRP